MSLQASNGGNGMKSWTLLAEGKKNTQDLIKPLHFSENKIERQIDLMCPDFEFSIEEQNA